MRKQFRNVQDSVYAAMRHNIRNLNLVPGTVISESEVSARYNVSRTPVREAFIRLADEALINVVPQKETMVSLIDLKRVNQEHFLRERLELAVLEPFIKYSTAEHIAQLQAYIKKQQTAYNNKMWIDFMGYDDAFHQVLYQASGQELSGRLVSSMSGHYYRIRLLSTWLNGVAGNVITQHQEMVDTLLKKDLQAAQSLLKSHLNKINDEEKILFNEYPMYFVPEEVHDLFETAYNSQW